MNKSKAIYTVVLVLVLTACSAVGGKNPTPLPTIKLDQASSTAPAPSESQDSGGATASGVVAPAQKAQMAFASAGTVQSIKVKVGEAVKAGQALIELDATDAQMTVQQAEADLAAAQILYDQAQSAEPARNEAQLASAQVALQQAQNALADLEKNAPLSAAQAQLALATANQALNDAQRQRTNLNYPRADQTTIDGAKAAYDLKEDELKKARNDYNQVSNLAADNPERAKALLDLTDAQKARDKALITLNWYLGKNSTEDLAQADAQLALAQAQVAEAQSKWSEVKDGPSVEDVSLMKEQIAQAQALLTLAQAQTAQQQIDLAQSKVETADARLGLARAALAKMTLTAPFDGVVASLRISVGEWANPGQIVLVLVDMKNLQIETTDLSERDIPKVSLGQTVTVFVKALNQEMSGKVIEISPVADTLGGDVVYKTTIALDEQAAGLLPGMSAEVQFSTSP